jgi:hypothetical protein
LDIIRTIACKRPIIAVGRTVQKINCIIGDASVGSCMDLADVESTQLGLQTVVNAIFNYSVKATLDTKISLLGIKKILEGLIIF